MRPFPAATGISSNSSRPVDFQGDSWVPVASSILWTPSLYVPKYAIPSTETTSVNGA